MKATKTTKSNTTLKVTGTRNGQDETLVLDFATEELARQAYWGLQGKGLKFEVMSTTTRYCDAEQALRDIDCFFDK